jgi:hypothetical protein
MGDALTILILITGVLVLGRTAAAVYGWYRYSKRRPVEWWGKR